MLFRIVFYIIVAYIIAKIFGIVLQVVRALFTPAQPGQRPAAQGPAGRRKMPYSNVEDVDYEDITEKKEKQ